MLGRPPLPTEGSEWIPCRGTTQKVPREGIRGFRHPTFIYPGHISSLCLNTLVLQRKLSPYALIFLNPHQPHVVFWACLIIHETPESSVTRRVPGRTPWPSLPQNAPCKRPPSSLAPWVGGQAGGQGTRRVFRPPRTSYSNRSRMGRAITAFLTSSRFCF